MGDHLSRAKVGDILTLVDECCEMWDDAAAWQRHFADWAERAVGGQHGAVVLFARCDGKTEVLESAPSSSRNEASRTLGDAWLSERAFEQVPIDPDARQAMRRDRSWANSWANLQNRKGFEEVAARYITPVGAFYGAEGYAWCPKRGTFLSNTLSRSRNEKPFSEEDVCLLRVGVESMAARCGKRLATKAQKGRHRLSPRQSATLTALLEGDSEKQVALRLGISNSTVHEYVTSLYRSFSVHSRGELMAYFVRKRP